MYLRRNGTSAPIVFWFRVCVVLLLILIPAGTNAQEFGASTAPKGVFLFKCYPKVFFTNAYFSDRGKALNLETVTGLLYLEVPLQVQYGLTNSLNVGIIVPVGWTYQEMVPDLRENAVHRFAVRELWLTVQHRWWTFLFFSSSSLRVKIPLSKKRDWEDGLHIGDGQVDVFPLYYVDLETEYWYTELSAGYKYRFKDKGWKPFDELKFKLLGGHKLFVHPDMRFYVYGDLTNFWNGEFEGDDLDFYEHEGRRATLGYGVSLRPIHNMRLDIETAGDLAGRNQYRGMRWTVGFTIIR
jgi:hypothetical protein